MGTHPIFESDFDCLTVMSGRDSKSPAISFDSDSDNSDGETTGAIPVVSPILAPTPTIAEKVKKANQDLLTYQSPPESRNSRIGFHEEPKIIEFQEAEGIESPIPPLATKSLPVSPLAAVTTSGQGSAQIENDNYSDDDFEEENKPEMIKEQSPEPEVNNEVKQEPKVTMENLVVEENGKFSVTGSNQSDQNRKYSSDDEEEENNKSRLSNYDPNPDYKSPYGLSKEQKRQLRKKKKEEKKKINEEK